jgi:hypothetical protein
MSDTEKTNFEFTPEPGLEELRGEVRSLRMILSCALLLVFIFSFCVNIFLFRQTRMVSAQLAQDNQLINLWTKGGPAQAQAFDFWNKLNDFAKTHPDFMPIINKYSPAFEVHPAPAPAPKKK